jgi:hypothetical protein
MSKNFYPEFPLMTYERTSVSMDDVIAYLKTLDVKKEIKCSAYVMFRNESANGTKGVNNNYLGIQADSGRWDDKFNDSITGTCVKAENMTGKVRIFLCFKEWKTSIDFLIDRVMARGLYVGGYAHLISKCVVDNSETLAKVYYQEWVCGSKNAVADEQTIKNFLSMYKQGVKLF